MREQTLYVLKLAKKKAVNTIILGDIVRCQSYHLSKYQSAAGINITLRANWKDRTGTKRADRRSTKSAHRRWRRERCWTGRNARRLYKAVERPADGGVTAIEAARDIGRDYA